MAAIKLLVSHQRTSLQHHMLCCIPYNKVDESSLRQERDERDINRTSPLGAKLNRRRNEMGFMFACHQGNVVR